MNFFILILMAMYRRHLIGHHQVRMSLRWMRQYSAASQQGQALPGVPMRVSRSRLLSLVAAGFKLSVHEPGVFMFGLLCFMPTVVYTAWLLARRVLRLMGV